MNRLLKEGNNSNRKNEIDIAEYEANKNKLENIK
jgi:hypothetical protein